MRLPALIALLALTAHAQGRFDRFNARTEQGRSTRGFDGVSLAFFEAFPAGGQGVTTACGTTAPTGAKGETLTFTRASGATCTKTATGGLATTGIADGDLVVLSSNQPRVEYDTNGVLGLLVEAARTNVCLRSEELDNASWATVSGAGCTVSANDLTAPDGTLTADRVSCAAGGFNARGQAVTTAGAGVRVWTAYVKDRASSNGITLRMVGTGDSAGDVTCEALTISTTSWTRVTCTSGSYGAGLTAISIRIFNSTTTAARNFDGYVWGSQVEVGAYATSYIPTAGATVTRATEGTPTFPVTFAAGSTVSAATSVYTNFVPTTLTTLASPPASGNPEILGRFSGGNFGCYMRTPGTDLAAGTWTAGQNRWACSSGRYSALNGTSATGAATTITSALSSVGIGSTGGFGAAIDGIYSRICMDPNPARCR